MSDAQPMALPSHEILARMASEDPAALEALRNSMVEELITRASDRIKPRLRGLQFRVDGIRRISRTPLGALIKIQAMMWDSFFRMNRELQVFSRISRPAPHLCGAPDRGAACPARTARILEFRPRMPSRSA